MEEQMTMFIVGLDASIKPMVSQYRQDNRDVSFLRLVNYAKAHGSASRAKEKKTKKGTIRMPATLRVGSKPKVPHSIRKNSAPVHLADSTSGSEGRRAQRSNENYYEGDFVAQGDFIEPSEGYGYGENRGSGTSTLQTPTYTTESHSEHGPRDDVPRARPHAGAATPDGRQGYGFPETGLDGKAAGPWAAGLAVPSEETRPHILSLL